MSILKTRFAAVAVLAMSFFLSSFSAHAQDLETASFSDEEINARFEEDRNMMTFNRLSGLLTDLLREQKRIYFNSNGVGVNQECLKAEELLNEANLLAAQSKYDEGFEVMKEAYLVIKRSLTEAR